MTEPGRPGACPRCGAPSAPGQDYCLECGLPLAGQAGVFTGLASAWARRGWYPGDWIWPVLVFLLLAALGALAAILLSNGSSSRTRLVATPPVATTSPTSLPIATAPITTAPPPTTSPPPSPPPPRHALITWPARDGYTIVLQSIPRSTGRTEAVHTAKEALAAGLTRVGVLDSAQYSSLHPGYYVVFSGVYSSNAAASAHLSQALSAGFKSAYMRPITH